MKKFFAITLVIVMMAMATTAFATDVTKDGGTHDITVNAKYNGSGTTEATVISVNVAWDAMEFTYNVGGSKVWHADDHSYTTSTKSKWSATNNTVTITNHSNIDVKVKTEYTPEETYKGITGAFTYSKTADTNGFITLTRGQVGKKNTADNVVATLTLSGNLSSSVSTSTKVGTITVTIAKKASASN